MAKTTRSTQRLVSRHIKRHKRKGMGQEQAVAAALSEARRKGRKVPPRRRGAAKGKRR